MASKEWLKRTVETRQELQDAEVQPDPKNAATVKPARKKTATPASDEAVGKSADKVNYVQTAAYIRRATYDEVKIQIIRNGRRQDFSDLVEELLTAWLKTQK